MSYISSNLNFLINAVKKAANSLSRDFNEIEKLQSSVRSNQAFIQSALDRFNRALRIELGKGRPDYAYVTDGQPVSGPQFLVSPLDGIINFAHGLPYYAVSVAVIENGVITSGVIYNPTVGDLYFAEKGQGAFREGGRNHDRLRVSARQDFVGSLISSNQNVFPEEATLRVTGSVSWDLAYVASGRLDAVVSANNSPASIAAGLLLVKEAGGSVLELNQQDIRSDDLAAVLASGSLIAVNGNLGKKIHELFN